MKILAFAFVLFGLISCKTSNIIVDKTSAKEKIVSKAKSCLDGGDCKIELLRSSAIILKKDTTNKFYPTIEEGSGMVVKFEYVKKGQPGIADADYSETVHFEIPEEIKTMNKKDAELETINALFGKHCFCRNGEAGYHKIKIGNLTLHKNKKEITFDLSFQMDSVSQKIVTIKETVKL